MHEMHILITNMIAYAFSVIFDRWGTGENYIIPLNPPSNYSSTVLNNTQQRFYKNLNRA